MKTLKVHTTRGMTVLIPFSRIEEVMESNDDDECTIIFGGGDRLSVIESLLMIEGMLNEES